jgi:deoxyribodipyrimidine photo-lyase
LAKSLLRWGVEVAIFLFGRDLRLADNPALHAAAARGPLIPVFIWDPHADDPWPPGAASRWWLHHSLRSLQSDLATRGSRLILRRGPRARVLQEIGVTPQFAHPSPATLFSPDAIRNQSGQPFRVFTPFYRACLEASPPDRPIDAPPTLRSPSKWPESDSLEDLELLPKIDWAAGMRETWEPGERGAFKRLKAAVSRLDNYASARDVPAVEGTSRLSPHLHFGELSPRQVWHAARGHDAFQRELSWREFAHHILHHFPETASQPMRTEFRRFPWRNDPAGLHAWQRGLTGYPLVDAGMRELWHTGWMHNRVRMVVASFLVKHLRIDWHEGAYWFWDTLVDADLANNTLNWQWAAGCGADAAPYFRIFNPALQAAKFDPDGDYVRRWVPEVGTLEYPKPIVDHAEARRAALASFASLRADHR